jgi:hypothetical protein
MLRPSLVKHPVCHRSFLFASAAMLVLLVGSAAKAEVSKSGDIAKPAWEWTVDERLAQRFAPEAMEARAADHSSEERAFLNRFPEAAADLTETKETGFPRQVNDSIEGNKTPELFLPFELFISSAWAYRQTPILNRRK